MAKIRSIRIQHTEKVNYENWQNLSINIDLDEGDDAIAVARQYWDELAKQFPSLQLIKERCVELDRISDRFKVLRRCSEGAKEEYETLRSFAAANGLSGRIPEFPTIPNFDAVGESGALKALSPAIQAEFEDEDDEDYEDYE